MPQGKHKGVRVVLTLEPESYEVWKSYAAKMDMPTATLLREVLETAREPMGEVVEASAALRSGEIDVDALLGRLLLGVVKEIRSIK